MEYKKKDEKILEDNFLFLSYVRHWTRATKLLEKDYQKCQSNEENPMSNTKSKERCLKTKTPL